NGFARHRDGFKLRLGAKSDTGTEVVPEPLAARLRDGDEERQRLALFAEENLPASGGRLGGGGGGTEREHRDERGKERYGSHHGGKSRGGIVTRMNRNLLLCREIECKNEFSVAKWIWPEL